MVHGSLTHDAETQVCLAASFLAEYNRSLGTTSADGGVRFSYNGQWY